MRSPGEISDLEETMERIAWCESRNNPLARNPTSSAKGRFQFLDSSWKYYGLKYWGSSFYEKDVFDYSDNTELAYWVASENQGFTDWDESKKCWGA